MTTSAPVLDVGLAIRAGRVLAMRHAPYLATALLRMVIVETEACPTAATDERWRFYINPGFAAGLTVEHLAYVWLHEVSHCLRAHPERWRALNEPDAPHVLFNIAGDALINADIDQLCPHALPDRVQLTDVPVPGAHRGMPVEELYRLLLRHQQDGSPGGSVLQPGHDCGSGAAGGHRPWELPDTGAADGSVDPADADLIRDVVATDIDRHHTSHGNVPAGLRRWAGERLQPIVDWHRELRAIISTQIAQHAGRRDYSYRRPSRRRVPGVVLPGMVGAAPPSVAVVIDTSGSMQPADLARALAETGDLVRRLGRNKHGVRVLTCDAAVHTAQVVRDVRQVALVGGGGTDMAAGIDSALALTPQPDLIVVITDGWTPWPSEPPPGACRGRPDPGRRIGPATGLAAHGRRGATGVTSLRPCVGPSPYRGRTHGGGGTWTTTT